MKNSIETAEQKRFEQLKAALSCNGQLLPVQKLMQRAADKWPRNYAVICHDEKMTYKELYQRSSLLAHTMREQGVQHKERVIIYYENSIEFYIAYYAVWIAGGIVVPLNVFLHENELHRIIDDAQPILIVVSPTLKEKVNTYQGILPAIIDTIDKTQRLPSKIEPLTEQTIVKKTKGIEQKQQNMHVQKQNNAHVGSFQEDSTHHYADSNEKKKQAASYEENNTTLTGNTNNKTNNQVLETQLEHVAAILYTSGTTGFPKGVMLSSYNIVMNAIQAIARFDFEEAERVFCPLPLFHSLPQNVCLWSTTVVGATAIIVPKIDRKTIIKGIAHKPTVVVAVPALFGLFCLLKNLSFTKVKLFFSGGDALSDKIRSFFGLIYRRKICNGYGLTETSPFISVDCDDYTQPTSTIGQPFLEMRCSIRNEQGTELKRGEIGTLWVKGPNVMLGYYKVPEATQAIVKDGWLNTGDLAYINKLRKIVLAGRERDLISNKGLKIYPQEVENILLTHPDVTQAAVIGIKEDQEELPIAFIASKETDAEKLARELRALCERNLAAYKIPRHFYIRKDLPVTATGKVDKKVLKA